MMECATKLLYLEMFFFQTTDLVDFCLTRMKFNKSLKGQYLSEFKRLKRPILDFPYFLYSQEFYLY